MTPQLNPHNGDPTKSSPRATKPVDEAKRLAASEITLSPATEQDAHKIAEGVYACFTQESIDKMDPPHLRPPMPIRLQRLAARIAPSFSTPGVHWIKAVHTPTNTIIGAAAWASPDLPVHNIFRRDAFEFYGWAEQRNLSESDVDEMYAHVDDAAWSGTHAKNDEIRATVMGGEEHWYLATLITWPEWQGRGVGRRLLDWGTERADSKGEAIYLEASDMSRRVYEHVGFRLVGEKNFIRRGPRGAEVREGDEEGRVGGAEKVDV
ncbi:hypothetical protein G6514_005364 [Epicoccum nigrum]|nr:hypothetical protein G6514_005364 [Epicoccum nigrum]